MKAKGIITQQIKLAPKDAIDLLEKVLKQNGITIYSRIDQQEEARKSGIKTGPLIFLLFGNPAKGGVVMLENPLAALDLPLKVLAWEDDEQKVWVAYNDGSYIKDRFSLTDSVSAPLNLDPIIDKVFGI